MRLTTLFFGLWICAAGWATHAQALTERECDEIRASGFAAGWAPGASDVERYKGFDTRMELPRLSVLLPVGGGWEMKVHSGNMLGFRSRRELEAARDRMEMVLHALEATLLGLSSRDHCRLEQRERLSEIQERVVEAILHPIPVRIVGHDGGYEWVRAK